jgi:hypothetical protein
MHLILEGILTIYRWLKYPEKNMIDIILSEDLTNFEIALKTICDIWIYLLYYSICLMSMIGIIKFEQLNSNKNFTSVIICTTLGSFKIVQCIFFDRLNVFLFEGKHQNFLLFLQNFSLILSMIILYPKYKSETMELSRFNKSIYSKGG